MSPLFLLAGCSLSHSMLNNLIVYSPSQTFRIVFDSPSKPHKTIQYWFHPIHEATPCGSCTQIRLRRLRHDGSSFSRHIYERGRNTIRNLQQSHDLHESMEATKGTCAVCQEEEIIAARIAGETVCEDCVVSGIIPKFFSALKHEAEYPPTWGRYRLHPRDFKPYIENADDFLEQYRMKQMEYEMLIARRLYCGKCQALVCDRDTRQLIRLGCVECKALICSGCGVVDENYWSHKCEEAKDAFEGLVKGKDFQVCPNPECALKCEIRDGCNAMVCPSSSCGTSFCFICGQPAGHNSDHWKAGSSCPRFNASGSVHAQFDRVVPPDHQRRLAPPPPRATAQDVIDAMNVDTVVPHRLLLMLHELGPLLPVRGLQDLDLADHPRVRALTLEQNMASELLATQFGVLMRHHQGQIDAMIQVAQAMMFDAETNGNPIPLFLSPAIDLMIKLRVNLDIYVWRHRVNANLDAWIRRHAEIFANSVHVKFAAEMHERFPMLIKIQRIYLLLMGMEGAIGLQQIDGDVFAALT